MIDFDFDFEFQDICEQAIGLHSLRNKLKENFSLSLDRVEPFAMDDDKFFEMLDVLSGIMFKSFHKHKPKKAIDEFYRRSLTGSQRFTLEEHCRFITTYKKLNSSMYRIYKDVDMNRGDDSFGDLIDSLPLAGKNIVEKVLSKELMTVEKLENAVRKEFGCDDDVYPHKHASFILDGENYIIMRLVELLFDRLPSFARQHFYPNN